MPEPVKRAAHEARYLMDRGYPAASAVRYASDHHRLPEDQRMVLQRVIIPAKTALSRMARARRLPALRDREIFLDGYNCIITAESLLAGFPVYLCDDGFLRDTRGFFRRYKAGSTTSCAIHEICSLLVEAGPSRAEFLLDCQISHSGELAGEIRGLMAQMGLFGDALCPRDVDRQLKSCGEIVASGDGNVIDSAPEAIDLPAEIARRRGISAQII
jgi:hypothetical protein